jgi:uncharacterized protein
MALRLFVLDCKLAICRLGARDDVPQWANTGTFTSITRTGSELSIVCQEESVPEGVERQPGWRVLQVEGPLAFELTGILASIAQPLTAAGVSLFAVSTFDTDYVLVREAQLDAAVAALRAAGHRVN